MLYCWCQCLYTNPASPSSCARTCDIFENYLLVNDKAKGIHIYDNSNVSSPVHLSFIAITGNMDFSVREGVLYADNITDLVMVDIKNPVAPKYVPPFPSPLGRWVFRILSNSFRAA